MKIKKKNKVVVQEVREDSVTITLNAEEAEMLFMLAWYHDKDSEWFIQFSNAHGSKMVPTADARKFFTELSQGIADSGIRNNDIAFDADIWETLA